VYSRVYSRVCIHACVFTRVYSRVCIHACVFTRVYSRVWPELDFAQRRRSPKICRRVGRTGNRGPHRTPVAAAASSITFSAASAARLRHRHRACWCSSECASMLRPALTSATLCQEPRCTCYTMHCMGLSACLCACDAVACDCVGMRGGAVLTRLAVPVLLVCIQKK
jgi:hypothetical protein